MIAKARIRSRILFTDECSVHLQSLINKQNDRKWAVENSHKTYDHVDIKLEGIYCLGSGSKLSYYYVWSSSKKLQVY